jgi:sugar phosphate isomerase/epimerase
MDRRTFLGTSVAAAFAASLPVRSAEPLHRIESIGLQLYTVRFALEKEFDATLAKVSAIGYREVEFAGYFNHSPKEIRAALDRFGLTAPSAHIDYEIVEKQWPQTLEAAHLVGHSYLICGWLDESLRLQPDIWKRTTDLFNRAGEASRKAGIQFGHHNYDYEYQPAESLGGKSPYDFLLAETDPRLVQMEMDLYWISVAGKDPLAYFARYPGRFPLVHVKDMTRDHRMTEAGSGIIDWKRIFAQSAKAGIKHYFVEQDDPPSPFDSIRKSFNFLRDLPF